MIKELEKIINYEFKNKLLIKEALTHPSISNQDNIKVYNYERLEFLGDSVLSLVISELLLNKFPNYKEGQLAKKRSFLVSGDMIVKFTSSIEIGNYIFMSKGEEKEGGRSNPSNIENAIESLIGAIYMDGGIKSAKSFIELYWLEPLESKEVEFENPKTILQEWLQSRNYSLPSYKIIDSEGSDHSPMFKLELIVEGFQPVYSYGASKKKAEKLAALKFLKMVDYEQN